MPVFALFNLNDVGGSAQDSAPEVGLQSGLYLNGASSVGGQAVLDGVNDIVKLYPDTAYQMDQGTLDIQFTLSETPQTGTQTVLSRDSTGETDGGFHIDILEDGSVVVVHEDATSGTQTFGAPAGFANPGDEIHLSYSWDEGGTGGQLVIENLTTGETHSEPVPDSVTMDMGAINQPWIIGAGQATSDPNMLNNIDQHFAGTVEYFQLSDTVDNLDGSPVAGDDAATTAEDTLVNIPVLGNDSDPTGQTLTVTSADAPNGTVTIRPDGTLDYQPDPNFNGTDTITYTVTDPDGNTDTATVTVTVTPANDAPVASDDAGTTPQGTPVTLVVLGNDVDVDGDDLSILGTPVSADGSVVVNPDGTLTFTPNPGFTGEAVITYDITDGNGGTDSATVLVTVTPDVRDGIVRGTDDGDLIDTTYTGDNDGDMVDAGDAILPGDAPNDDRILAGDGNDTVVAGDGDDSVEGNNGSDDLDGGEGDDSLYGGSAADTITGGNGNDLVEGGTGSDLIDTSGDGLLPDIGYPGLWEPDADPTNDLDTVYGGSGNDTILTGDDADLIEAGSGRDYVDGGIDDDTISGGNESDTIIGAEGNDLIDAGSEGDLVYGGYGPGVPDAVNIPDDAGDLRPDNGQDTIYGGAGNDTIFGQDDDDVIDGGTGNDLIDGGIDDDVIVGGIGNDTITGGQGSDTSFGGDDRDTFIGAAPGDVVNGDEGGDDFDTLDLRGSGPLIVAYDPANAENGTVTFLDADGNPTGTMTFSNIENVIPCFTPGTMIATPRGEVPVEALRAGDKIITRDNGIQEIRWMGRRDMGWHELAANPHLKPVLVRQGSLGNGLPERDMMVSPNHRLLVANDRTALYFDEHEVLVAAKHLTGAEGVKAVDVAGTSYIHFMCDRHEVVLSDGAWTESFQPGDMTLGGMGNAQRSEIFDLFPDLKGAAGREAYGAARRTLKRHEALLLVK